VSELEKEYAGRLLFSTVVPTVAEDGTFVYPDSSKQVEHHGLEGRDATGKVVTIIEGHDFGRDQIVEVAEGLLADQGD
jgi:hypothetical protein